MFKRFQTIRAEQIICVTAVYTYCSVFDEIVRNFLFLCLDHTSLPTLT